MKYSLINIILLLGLLSAGGSNAAYETDSIHGLFDQVLSQHVKNGRVDYKSIESDPRFTQYLNSISVSEPDKFLSREEKLAFWINAYNALAIRGIIDGRSPSSFFGRIGYFKLANYIAGNRQINLYDLEREILVPLGEPRIHFAIVCASVSCPPLRSEAYVASQLEQQLEANASTFINNPSKNRFDGDTVYISKIFDWFQKDFSTHSGSVQKYLAQYVEDPDFMQKLAAEALKIRHLAYNWHLNGEQID